MRLCEAHRHQYSTVSDKHRRQFASTSGCFWLGMCPQQLKLPLIYGERWWRKGLPKKLATLLSHLRVLVLDNTFWPSIMDTDYGENEVRQLCNYFRLPYSPVRDAYCDYKDSGGKHIASELKTLTNCVNTIPCSMAECELVFSAMNLIATDICSKLMIKQVSTLMFIKVHTGHHWLTGSQASM